MTANTPPPAQPSDRHAAGGSTSPARPDGAELAARWDARYAATDRVWSVGPNATVAEVVTRFTPGTALDVATGEGRHALWLAERGWRVTAVDVSAVGIARGQSQQHTAAIDWQIADVRSWQPPQSFDLVLVAYLHLAENVLSRIARWVAPGGHLVVVGHALRNITDGVGGPSEPERLQSEDDLRTAAAGLEIERLEEVFRETDAGTAIDVCLVARRPTVGAAQ